jgi:hypothetical protein
VNLQLDLKPAAAVLHFMWSRKVRDRGSLLHRLKNLGISAFILFHIVAITFWCIPIDSPLIPLCRNLVRPYFLWAGLFQSWDMFAPIPQSANTYIDAVVVYRDGSKKAWTFPRMERLGWTDKLFKERYRKYADYLAREDTEALLPDAARHIVLLTSAPQNQVTLVMLIQHWSFIVPQPDGSYVPEPWEQHVLLGYGVRPEDLK